MYVSYLRRLPSRIKRVSAGRRSANAAGASAAEVTHAYSEVLEARQRGERWQAWRCPPLPTPMANRLRNVSRLSAGMASTTASAAALAMQQNVVSRCRRAVSSRKPSETVITAVSSVQPRLVFKRVSDLSAVKDLLQNLTQRDYAACNWLSMCDLNKKRAAGVRTQGMWHTCCAFAFISTDYACVALLAMRCAQRDMGWQAQRRLCSTRWPLQAIVLMTPLTKLQVMSPRLVNSEKIGSGGHKASTCWKLAFLKVRYSPAPSTLLESHYSPASSTQQVRVPLHSVLKSLHTPLQAVTAWLQRLYGSTMWMFASCGACCFTACNSCCNAAMQQCPLLVNVVAVAGVAQDAALLQPLRLRPSAHDLARLS